MYVCVSVYVCDCESGYGSDYGNVCSGGNGCDFLSVFVCCCGYDFWSSVFYL